MKNYTKIQTFTTDEIQKEKLEYLRKNKINVSKFIRNAVNEKLNKENLIKKDNRRKPTIEDLKQSLELCLHQ